MQRRGQYHAWTCCAAGFKSGLGPLGVIRDRAFRLQRIPLSAVPGSDKGMQRSVSRGAINGLQQKCGAALEVICQACRVNRNKQFASLLRLPLVTPGVRRAHRPLYFPGKPPARPFQIGTVVGSYSNKPRSSALRPGPRCSRLGLCNAFARSRDWICTVLARCMRARS
jgi:hypothetical protein